MKKFLQFLFPILLCFLLGWFASLLQEDSIREWYPFLAKPALTPPNIAFPIAWGIIYLCMGVAAGLLLSTPRPGSATLLRLWFIQLIVNFCWSLFFFWFRSPAAGLADILLLDALVIAFVVKAWPCHRAAAILFLPYLIWIAFATYLNVWILVNN